MCTCFQEFHAEGTGDQSVGERLSDEEASHTLPQRPTQKEERKKPLRSKSCFDRSSKILEIVVLLFFEELLKRVTFFSGWG